MKLSVFNSRMFLIVFLYFRYVEEHIQRTGVAIETQGFTVVTSGKKRESLLVSFATLLLPLSLFRLKD